jgi:glutamate synthase domain-containing protein 2
MSNRYHVNTRPAPAPFGYPAKFRLSEGDEYVKYGHAALPEGRRGGDAHWTPQVITQTWYQAETGRIPISGAGYGGPFAGPGFDAIWLDMSEIVRPTRDGIHGREYISTATDLGRRLPRLEFDIRGQLTSVLPPVLQIPIPVLFNPIPMPVHGRGMQVSIARAAAELGTFAIVPLSEWADDLTPYADHLVPLLTPGELVRGDALAQVQFIELEAEGEDAILRVWEQAKRINPQAIVSVRLPLEPGSLKRVERLAREGVEVVHLCADDLAQEQDGSRPLPDALRAVHEHLVQACLRDAVTLVASGGIAAAEHVPKAIACGADAVGVDVVLLVALGCALWADMRYPCPVEHGEIDPIWGAQRLVNLMAAWRDQLVEVLGAMGLREVRRLRGELGRAIFYREEERAFRQLFRVQHCRSDLQPATPFVDSQQTNKAKEACPMAVEGEIEGDLRWTRELLLSTAEQARTGRPPTSGLEYRTGRSGGGFDRLRLVFEFDDEQHQEDRQLQDDDVDLSLELNRRKDGRPGIRLPHPWYGAGMSFGSISLNAMLARARAAQMCGSFTSTGEGGYPDELVPYADRVITQVATGLFGVREETIQRARIVEFKYAQGAKPGLGGHLLGSKVTAPVAAMREAVQGCSLFSPFPFHSVYSVEDHKKHVDWIKAVNPGALISVKVSTPTDVDMVVVGSYYAGAHIVHLDGGYGGTGAAPEIAKKNIAMPIEYAISKVHRFLEAEGIRDEIVVMASGGVRTAYDIAKAIALGADGCVIGSAELVALGCTRLGTCEKAKGCPLGIATTDPELCKQIDPEQGAQRITNLYGSWRTQLASILRRLGLSSVRELRGRADLLIYLG